MNQVSAKQVFSFVLKMITSFRSALFVMFLVAFIWAIDLSLKPYLLKVILNRVTDHPTDQIFHYILFPIIAYLSMIFLISSIFRIYNYFVDIKMIPLLRQKISENVFSYLLEHSHHFYQNHFSGSLANKINDLTLSIPNLVQITIDRFFAHLLALNIAIFTLWQVNIKFALAVMLWTFLFISGSFFYSKKLQYLSNRTSEIRSVFTGKIVDVLSNILSVRLFAQKQAEKKLLNQTVTELVRAGQKFQWANFWLWFVYGYSFFIVQGISFYFLIQGRQAGTISVGDFALVLGINTAIVDFLWQLTKDFTEFSEHYGRVTQALSIINTPIEIQDKPNAKPLEITQGEVVFDKVQFYYKGSDPLFEEKSVILYPGQKIGLVGSSGSGKSTFVNLILRLFEVTQGRILIDGQDIREVTQDSLHRAIALIPQDPSLFHRTLKENIRYANPEANENEIIIAAKRAHAHEFIHVISEGYESLVGERGVKLSGGQRQRIAIARAMLKNAPILILDEATSQLDSITEGYIQESLWDLMQNKTTLIIAHRLSTLLHMDRILVFDKGKIVQDGTHETLLNSKGLYKTLWDAQVGGFLLDDE